MKMETDIQQRQLGQTTTDDVTDIKESDYHVEEVAVARLTDEDLYTLSAESLKFWSMTGVRICGIMLVQGFNQAGYGVDWGVIGGINSFKAWHNYFGFGTSGATYGTLNALMTIGIFCGSPCLALADVIGRRGINFVGNVIVIAAAFMQAFAMNVPTLMAARFILGFGTAFMSSPQYIAEVAPVHLRGRLVGMFGACFQVGSLVTSAAMIGFVNIDSNWSWRVPFLLEALFPVLVCSLIYLLTPESPRYLILRGRRDEARAIIAKYQTTTGDLNQPLVDVVTHQIEESLIHETSAHRQFWDYRVFFTRPVRYRLLVLVIYSVFQQWNGGGILSYYLAPALETIGVTGSNEQLGINLGLVAVYLVFTFFGSFLLDLVKRRTLIFSGLASFVILQTAATITSWRYDATEATAAAYLTILWMFLFQVFSSLLIAGMHNLYPAELLSLVLRARGMGLYGMIQGIAGTVHNYGISIGINRLGYKIWVVYIVYNALQLVVAYFVFPETFRLSLEDIDSVFETPGVAPVKMSLKIQKAKKEKARLEAESGQAVLSS